MLIVDADHGGHIILLVPQNHRLHDIGTEFELVFNEHGGKSGAVLEVHQVLDAIDDHQVAVRGKIAGIP